MSEVLNFDASAMEGQLSTEVFLKLQPPHFSRTYGVTIELKDEETEAITIKFETIIRYIRTLQEEKIRLFEVSRLDSVYINDMIPSDTADQLAYEVGKVFYPLVVAVDFDGSYAGIHNQTEILKRWPEVKKQVLDYFTGAETDQYLLETEVVIADSFALDICFRKDWFISTFFASYYKSYGAKREVEVSRSFFLRWTGEPDAIEVKEKLDGKLNSYGGISIHHEVAAEQDSPFELESDQVAKPATTYEAAIVLHKTTKSIESIVASWTWMDGHQKQVELRCFRIDEEMNEEEREPSFSNSSLVFIDKPEQKEGMKQFFSSLFKKSTH